MDDSLEALGVLFAILNVIYFFAYIIVFWTYKWGEIYIWEIVMLYVFVVFVPIVVVILIGLVLLLVRD